VRTDIGCGVEESEATRELATAVKGRQVINNEREKGRLSHSYTFRISIIRGLVHCGVLNAAPLANATAAERI
jgi:hypothetical protein